MTVGDRTEAFQQAPRTVPRRAWVAVLLTLLLPGLGHLYAGAPRRSLFVWLLSLVAGVVTVVVATSLTIIPGAVILLWLSVAILALYGLAARDAALCARRAGPSFVLRGYNRWYVYVAVFLAIGFLLQPQYVKVLRNFLQAYSIPNASMEPTLLAGDYILAKPLWSQPARGQLVIYRRRMGPWVKRVVGLPGDTLAMRDGALSLNGQAVFEPWASHAHEANLFDSDFEWQRRFLAKAADLVSYHPTLTFWGPIVVPPGRYFVLGDNRGESADSRYTGFVEADSIVQRPVLVYFSRDLVTGVVRWRRIGTRFTPP